MAKRSCKVVNISFTTKRGRKVAFRGRKGGQKQHGGHCADKKTAQQSKMGAAARRCVVAAKPGTKTNANCIKAFLTGKPSFKTTERRVVSFSGYRR